MAVGTNQRQYEDHRRRSRGKDDEVVVQSIVLSERVDQHIVVHTKKSKSNSSSSSSSSSSEKQTSKKKKAESRPLDDDNLAFPSDVDDVFTEFDDISIESDNLNKLYVSIGLVPDEEKLTTTSAVSAFPVQPKGMSDGSRLGIRIARSHGHAFGHGCEWKKKKKKKKKLSS